MKKKISITDVAKETGLSVTTVSQILNGKGNGLAKNRENGCLLPRRRWVMNRISLPVGWLVSVATQLVLGIPDIMNPFFASFVVSVEKAAIPQGLFPQIFQLMVSMRMLIILFVSF